MSDNSQLLAYYEASVAFPEVSGFEILELLDVRTRLALIESELNPAEKDRLERADEVFLSHATEFYERIAEIANIREMRQRAAVPVSHWWWHLEKIVRLHDAATTT